jgi:hypothetical protein
MSDFLFVARLIEGVRDIARRVINIINFRRNLCRRRFIVSRLEKWGCSDPPYIR